MVIAYTGDKMFSAEQDTAPARAVEVDQVKLFFMMYERPHENDWQELEKKINTWAREQKVEILHLQYTRGAPTSPQFIITYRTKK